VCVCVCVRKMKRQKSNYRIRLKKRGYFEVRIANKNRQNIAQGFEVVVQHK
jgi:hypothetical protein